MPKKYTPHAVRLKRKSLTASIEMHEGVLSHLKNSLKELQEQCPHSNATKSRVEWIHPEIGICVKAHFSCPDCGKVWNVFHD